MLTQTELPLIMSNGSFKSLKTLDEPELESFIKYLMRFWCKKNNMNYYQKPSWWSESLPFPMCFIEGSPIPYVKNKFLYMKKMVKTCYIQNNAIDLLLLSDSLSKLHSFQISYLKNPNNETITVFKNGSPVVVIPASNINYDYKYQSMTIDNEVTVFNVEKTQDPEVTIMTKCLLPMARKSTGGRKLISPKKTLIPPKLETQLSKINGEDKDPDIILIENIDKNKFEDDEVVLIEDSDDDCIITSEISFIPKPKLIPQRQLLVSRRRNLHQIHRPAQNNNVLQNIQLLKKQQQQSYLQQQQQQQQQSYLQQQQQQQQQSYLQQQQQQQQQQQHQSYLQNNHRIQPKQKKQHPSYLRNRELLQQRQQQKLKQQQQQQQQQQQRKSKRKSRTAKNDDLIVLSEDEEVLDNIIVMKRQEMEKADKESTQESFLNAFGLAPRSCPVPTKFENDVFIEKERITNVFFTKISDLSLIPQMVNIGMIPKKCLADPSVVEKNIIEIESLTNRFPVDEKSIRPCFVLLKKLDPEVISRWIKKRRTCRQSVK